MRHDEPEPDERWLENEERWSRGSALGEAVWSRMCSAAGWDPKDDSLQAARAGIVDVVRSAFAAMDGEGMTGLAEWLDMEEWMQDA